MRPWREDPRFRCPHCGTLVYLTLLDPAGERATRDEVAAICVPCQRVFFVEEWRQLYTTRKASMPADS